MNRLHFKASALTECHYRVLCVDQVWTSRSDQQACIISSGQGLEKELLEGRNRERGLEQSLRLLLFTVLVDGTC